MKISDKNLSLIFNEGKVRGYNNALFPQVVGK